MEAIAESVVGSIVPTRSDSSFWVKPSWSHRGDDHDRSHQTIVGESIVYRAIQAIGHIRAFKG